MAEHYHAEICGNIDDEYFGGFLEIFIYTPFAWYCSSCLRFRSSISYSTEIRITRIALDALFSQICALFTACSFDEKLTHNTVTT